MKKKKKEFVKQNVGKSKYVNLVFYCNAHNLLLESLFIDFLFFW